MTAQRSSKFIAFCAVALLSTPAAAQDVALGPLTAQLYYKHSGRLSDDLLAREEPFVGWNTIIGEGSAEEPAEDLLVAVTLASNTGDGVFLEEQLELWVENAEGSRIARRVFDGVLVPYQGTVSSPLWLSDVGCVGRLELHARLGDEERIAELSLDCGE